MTAWQDIALTIINFAFIFTLIPAVIKNYKLKDVKGQSLLTASSTSILLLIMAYVLFTLSLYLSFISTIGTAIMWFILTYQNVAYSRIKR
ncbi:MAG: hypothetical protein QXS02_02765 [Candidatus Thermoplasmatota archaeon]